MDSLLLCVSVWLARCQLAGMTVRHGAVRDFLKR